MYMYIPHEHCNLKPKLDASSMNSKLKLHEIN